jgi:Cu/Ag efflux protein CusF
VVAQVMAVNKEAQIVTVKGPKGQVVDLHVQDPAQMQGIAKGDRVQAVYTQAVAVSVVPGPGK